MCIGQGCGDVSITNGTSTVICCGDVSIGDVD